MDKLLVFDLWGDYGHFKKIYATTSALTYPVPFKTAIYGLTSAIIGLSKEGNSYLEKFPPGACKIGIELLSTPRTQRLHTNFSLAPGMIKSNRKPTLLELLKAPRYRIFWTHQKDLIYEHFKSHLKDHTSVYTPSLGLANLLANFKFIGEYRFENCSEATHQVSGVIPMSGVKQLDGPQAIANKNELVEVAMYAMEMDINRNVTRRDDILFDRRQQPVSIVTDQAVKLIDYPEDNHKIILF